MRESKSENSSCIRRREFPATRFQVYMTNQSRLRPNTFLICQFYFGANRHGAKTLVMGGQRLITLYRFIQVFGDESKLKVLIDTVFNECCVECDVGCFNQAISVLLKNEPGFYLQTSFWH